MEQNNKMSWNLSDKINEGHYISHKYIDYSNLDIENVREFIKQLKDDIHLNISTSPLVDEIIDKLAGDKLI